MKSEKEIKAIAERIWMIENSPLYANDSMKENELEQLMSDLTPFDIFSIDEYIMSKLK